MSAANPEPAAADICVSHDDLLVDMTTQMLGMNKLDERLQLSLEVITSGFGYSRAALALIDEKNESLRMHTSIGFNDDASVEGLNLSLDSAPHVSIIHKGHPAWIS